MRFRCGRGGVSPRSGSVLGSPIWKRSAPFNEAGAVVPGRSVSPGFRVRTSLSTSMRPGEYPPEGRSGERLRVVVVAASMRPGEYPPEGRRPGVLLVSGGVAGFNEAGGVSPGGSRPPCADRARYGRASMRPGEYPPEGPAGGLRGERGFGASMRPGEYPPEGPDGRLRLHLSDHASMRPGEYPPEGRWHRAASWWRWSGFNEAGGVSPGGSDKHIHPVRNDAGASMRPGEYPPEGRCERVGAIRGVHASMRPGEYPPEGPVSSVRDDPLHGASMRPGEYPPEGPAGLRSTRTRGRRFNEAGGGSPGGSPLVAGRFETVCICFNEAGGVSPGGSARASAITVAAPMLQ